MPGYDTIVFCDFDGTITRNETLTAVCRRFAPETAARVGPRIGAGEVTLREGVSELIGALRSRDREAIVDFIATEPLRPGFEQLLQTLSVRGIPFVVLSSGLRFYIEARLQRFAHLIHAIHALDVDTRGEYMRVQLPRPHATEAMPKADVAAEYNAATTVMIGDSTSDFGIATTADRVFARDDLLKFGRARGLPCVPFEDFDDVRRALSNMVQPTGHLIS